MYNVLSQSNPTTDITLHSHITFLYLIVLMLIYCKYKSTVTELITLQIIHCTLYLIFFISILIFVYCRYKSTVMNLITDQVSYCYMLFPLVCHSVIIIIKECVRVNFMSFILCIFLHVMFCTNKMH